MAIPRGTDVQYIGSNASGGMSLGLDATEKISFYGLTPIVQRTGSAGAKVTTTSAITCSIGGWGYDTATQANAIVTLVNELRATLIAYGLHTGAA